MFGNAWLVNDSGLAASIPVLPLTDDTDGTPNAVPTAADNVIYGPMVRAAWLRPFLL